MTKSIDADLASSPSPVAKEASPGHSATKESAPISTIIYDVDDTLYDVSTGFTAHRNTFGATSFMVAKLGFPDVESAQALRDEYFERFHSTAKALTVAEAEGRFPPLPLDNIVGEMGDDVVKDKKPRFDPKDLQEWWAENLDYSILGGPDPDLIAMMRRLRSAGLRMIAFSNGPRQYVRRVLKEIGMEEFFPPDMVFAVDDVLPACKPEAAAFERVFKDAGVTQAEGCIMVEDSMKNLRAAKALGMKTVLVAGKGRLGQGQRCSRDSEGKLEAAEATKPGDAPVVDDPAVDLAVELCSEMMDALPGLHQEPPVFSMK